METHRVGSSERFRNLYNRFATQKTSIKAVWDGKRMIHEELNRFSPIFNHSLYQIDVGAFLSESSRLSKKMKFLCF